METVECTHCNESYRVKPCKVKQTKYCSKECHTESQKRRVTLVCEYCEDQYEVKQSHSKASRFCSRVCKDTHKRERPNPTVPCSWCGESLERRRYDIEHYENQFCDEQCMGKWRSRNIVGEEHPQWKDGTYAQFGDNWFWMRRKIRERDEVCQICREDGSSHMLDVHHIVPRREFDMVENSNTPYNLVLLCRSCHKRVEHGSIPCPHPTIQSRSVADKIDRFLRLFRVGLDGFEPSASAL
ncbi:HNH endonuclease [Halorussus halophilus]|uniref:HNH endonuclease n=1 Tax=Halorussus halophilus TaxID=2650975 RepID=UPI001301917B